MHDLLRPRAREETAPLERPGAMGRGHREGGTPQLGSLDRWLLAIAFVEDLVDASYDL